MTAPQISDDGNTITVELTPDQLLLIICALRVDNYQYSEEYKGLKWWLERDLSAASKFAEGIRRVEAA